MKKFKFMLVALMAVLCNVTMSAAPVYDESATTVFRYQITEAYTPAAGEAAAVPGKAEIIGFVADYVKPTTVAIPATVNDARTPGAYYNVVGIAEGAFEGEAVDFSFAQATNLVTIGEGAFKGTNITILDLSATKVAEIGNFFGTTLGEEAVENSTLTTVILPNAWTAIADDAFVNCTALATVDFGEAPEFVDPDAEEPVPFEQEIAAGGFAKTAIVELDLSKTKVASIQNLFGTVIGDGDANITYPSLKTVKLPNAWNEIAESAFANCTALATIDFGTAPEPEGAAEPIVQVIGELALANTAVTALDFSKTFVAGVPDNLLYDPTVEGAKNTTLQTVTINKCWQFDVWEEGGGDPVQVYAGTAFANCEALTTFTGLDATIPGEGEEAEPVALYNHLPIGAFKGDKALTTINTSTIMNFDPSVFEGCAALTTVDLSAATWIGDAAFKETGLTAVTIPGTVGYICANAFKDCAALATVTFSHNIIAPEEEGDPDLDPFYGIGEYAFYGTAIEKIVIPSTLQPLILDEPDEMQDGTIGARAFADSKVSDFTLKPITPVAGMVDANAFVGCEAVTFRTIQEYVNENEIAPKKCTYVIEDPEVEPIIPVDPSSLPATESKKDSQKGKYYVKFFNNLEAPIMVKTTDAKVYAAYLDDVTCELNMQMFKSKGGYYHIAAGDVVLMLTSLEAVPYEPSENVEGSSWLEPAREIGDLEDFDVYVSSVNQLQYVTEEDGKLRSDIEADAPAETPDIYGWINNATYGYGFQRITSGKTFPQGTLYLLAKAPAEGANARVIWRDENGNIEDETTAIQGIVEAKAENGMIYNLAGQKVNASYKGVVIKDGKKYMK